MLPYLALCLLLQDGLRLTYETSEGKATGDYAETVNFCRRLSKAAPQLQVLSFGQSASGRELIAVTLSTDLTSDPAKLKASGKPLIYVECGIHAGEVEGKDATLILLRDMLIAKKQSALLEHANFLVVPVLNVDGHERRSPFNRINQNGPEEMGFRANDQNLNLNRDWVKLDAPETRQAVALINRYRPDFFFDCHTSDGADYPYRAMLGVPSTPSIDFHIAEWSSALYQSVATELNAAGIPTCPYFEFEGDDPAKGIGIQEYSPRYSTGYWGARNRPSMLIETHMLKPYSVRVETTYSVLINTIRYVEDHRDSLLEASVSADNHDLHAVGSTYVLASAASGTKREIPFLLYESRPFQSEITGSMVMSWTHKTVEARVAIQDDFQPTVTATSPAGFAIPAAQSSLVGLLKAHGFLIQTLKHPIQGHFASDRLSRAEFKGAPFEGRQMPQFQCETVQREETLPAGTAIVGCDQPGVRLLLQLLIPAAPDSLMHWGFFNALLERKEYFENYAMEPIAKQMLDGDPALRAAFTQALSDPKFAASPRARLNWFYERSKYSEPLVNQYPILMLSSKQLEVARN